MPKILIIGNQEFEFPVEGENASWGEQVTDWATAVTEALETVQKPNDLLDTTAAINNNQTTFSNIPGFSFDTSQVISIEAKYIINRSTVSPSVKITESGKIEGNFDGTSWKISISGEGEADVEFDITPSGQIQYKSSNMTGSGYVGQIIFSAKVFNSVV